MGIGRREFIKVFGGAIASLSANPESAIAIVDDLYVNRKLGIAFRCPTGWTFASFKEMGSVKAGQILDLEDDDLARDIVDSVELPIVTISQDPLSSGAERFTPGVTVYVDIEAESDDDSLTVLARNDARGCGHLLREFTVCREPSQFSVSNCDAVEYTARFVFEHENIEPTPVRLRSVLIRQPPRLLTFRMYDSPDESLIANYDQFLESVAVL